MFHFAGDRTPRGRAILFAAVTGGSRSGLNVSDWQKRCTGAMKIQAQAERRSGKQKTGWKKLMDRRWKSGNVDRVEKAKQRALMLGIRERQSVMKIG